MTVQTDSKPPSTTQQKEWHYIYVTCKKVSKAPHIISHFKNDTMSTKNYLTNYALAIKRRTWFVACARVHLLNHIVSLVNALH